MKKVLLSKPRFLKSAPINEIAGAKRNRRPDVMGVRHNRIIDQVEVPSKTDDSVDLIERMIDNQKIQDRYYNYMTIM